MKVLLLNGSPRKEGCTYTALTEVANTLKKNGIEAEIFQAGDPSRENVTAAAEKMKEADALVVGSPVYWLPHPDRSWNLWINLLLWQENIWSTSQPQLLLLQDAPAQLQLWTF